MIDKAIECVMKQVNGHLKMRFCLNEDLVIASALVGVEGTKSTSVKDKVILTLVNVEKDTTTRLSNHAATLTNHDFHTPLTLVLNLRFMVSVNFTEDRYLESLKFLAAVIEFFDRTPVLDHQTDPNLDQAIERLTIDADSMSTNELSRFWQVNGGRYLPSVLYRMRMIAVESPE